MATKRKRPVPPLADGLAPEALSRSGRSTTDAQAGHVARQDPKPPHRLLPSRGGPAAPTNPNAHPAILDGIGAPRASPDGGDDVGGGAPHLKPREGRPTRLLRTTGAAAHATTEIIAAPSARELLHGSDPPNGRPALGGGATTDNPTSKPYSPSETPAAAPPDRQPGTSSKRKKTLPQHVKVEPAESNNYALDIPETAALPRDHDVGVLAEAEEGDGPKLDHNEPDAVKEALSRPPPVNSDYLPLPWKGRLGYACLNTYLRNANPPVFSSRTCRIASILEHRHPLKDPSQPEHATKNRPDKDQPPDVARGQRYVEELGLANARDVIKMLRWNDRYGIKFMRLSSEMFPFASHEEYGYKLEPFASDTLAEVGRVVAELGHRVTMHPGQFTQLGSPRREVITAAVRDLDVHCEMLSLLKLPPQQDRDAVTILHLGGAFGDKAATLDRFRENYAKLSQPIKDRLVLENDDVIWSVHDLLPLCQELNIPFVLDFHHHNIIFDSTKIREGTRDIVELFPAIIETWKRKGITPKMHYSEPCPNAVTGRDRRKHSPRVMTLPPCPDTMDLMIEAKDKEQAVFELIRTFKLPGFDLINDIIPHVREDENRPVKPTARKTTKKGKREKSKLDEVDDLEAIVEEAQAIDLVPEEEIGMGGPQRRVYWPPGMEDWLRPPKRAIKMKEEGATMPAKKKRKITAPADASRDGQVDGVEETKASANKAAPKKAASSSKKKKPKAAPTPSPSVDEEDSAPLSDVGDEEDGAPVTNKQAAPPAAASTRKRPSRASRVSYKEDADDLSL